tara:strand:- start:3874 stop:4521 length:648 start_codon:yes stop_codon:yes gene_type:complete
MSDFKYHVQWLKSPGYLMAEVPSPVVAELRKSMYELEKSSENDARDSLRGHLEEEWTLPLTKEIKSFTRCLSYEYVNQFGFQPALGMAERMHDINNSDFELKRLWVNYQKKYDFNPLHIHSGIFSFVIWVQIPYDLEEERKRYPKTSGNETASFMFQYNTALGGLDTAYINVDKTWEWKIVFFPARLNHGVNPFYTTDNTRISISGNIYVIDNKE